MIDIQKINELDLAFQRILILPVSRSTFRQMQNAILGILDGDREKATQLLDALLNRDLKAFKGQANKEQAVHNFITRYAIPLAVARDVSERGEFISIVTSDIIGHPELPIFGNRICRIDGKELEFITDPATTVQLLLHFAHRLQEMEKVEKDRKVLKGLKKELTTLKSKVEQLIASSSD